MIAGSPDPLAFSGTIVNALQNRSWLCSRDPIHHFHVRDVFQPHVYAAFEQHFLTLLGRGLSARPDGNSFARMPGYDAYAFPFTRDLQGPLSLFTSRLWHDLIASAYALRATGDVRAGLHHHVRGSAHGGVHNDFNPGWFAGEPQRGKVNLSDASLCSYHTGHLARPGITARPTVRAVAVLFYLCNPPWQPGDGGETALFRSYTRTPDKDGLRVPPISNSMLVFECTPESWHTFLSNGKHARNSLIMWLHRDYAEAVRRWGEDRIVKW